MLARLGFSIAVNIGADILLVDEVLAVGDLEFERKCYAKIDELRANGTTILFVSHHLDSIRRVADRCIWLKDGLIIQSGDCESVLSAYENASGGSITVTEVP
jgi:ABC-type polysaccharide/polyol phosphate transport system ATPase subunit